MLHMTRVKIVEVSKVMPSSSQDSPTLDSFFLTYFDIIWLTLPPVQSLFFYKTSYSKAAFYSDIIPRLKLSLSLTLSHYFPLSGNLVWPESSTKPYITNKNGGGVSFTVAESDDDDANFSYLMGDGDGFVEAEACHPLVPNLALSELVAIQVTSFPDAGFSVAISTHHAVVDGKSWYLFMRSWAHICRLGKEELPEGLRPVLDRSVIKDEEKLAELYAKQWQDFGGGRGLRSWDHVTSEPGLVRATFTLTPDNIAKLRQLVQSSQQLEGNEQIRLSTFCLAYAYMVFCSVKAEAVLSREHAQIILIVAYDCRSRMEPTVPESYFGNCVAGSIMAVEEPTELVERHGLLAAVKAVDKTIKGIDKDLRNKKMWLSRLITGISKQSDCVRMYSIAEATKFDVYGVDFGWGRPKKVDIVSIDRTKALSFSDSRNGDGGVEIGLVLNKIHMEAFAFEFAQGLQ